MIERYSSIIQTFLGTCLTWFVTALGALCCFAIANVSNKFQHQFLDGCLGFSAGIMMAASFWSLLFPALSMARYDLGLGLYALLPVTLGFLGGAVFVALTHFCLPEQWFENTHIVANCKVSDLHNFVLADNFACQQPTEKADGIRKRLSQSTSNHPNRVKSPDVSKLHRRSTPMLNRHLWLLIVAITMHNIPEGLAVGIGFGSIGEYPGATFAHARNLAVGIAIQNFPEGLAISLPMQSAGYGFAKSFWYGQLSGVVEIVFGLVGCMAVKMVRNIQPYALSFSAGAMIFVVFNDVIPESHSRGNGFLASTLSMVGFIVMMSLDILTGSD